MTTATDEGFDALRWTKLPAWAQSDFKVAMQKIRLLREQVEAGPGDSNTFAEPYAKSSRPLGKDVQIEWRLDSGRYVVNVGQHTKGGLYVMTSSQITVHPRSSNALEILNREW